VGDACTTDAPPSAPTAAATRGRAQPRGRRAAAGERPQGETAAVVRLCTFAIARAPRPWAGSTRAPCSLARTIAHSPPCSPCVPRTGLVHAPPPRCSVQYIGGGGAGAARGVLGGRQGDDQGTPSAPSSVARRRRARPLAAPSSRDRRPPRRSATPLFLPLLAACAAYRTGARLSTTPPGTAHRRWWCRRSSRRTRMPSRRRTVYAAPSPVCRDHAASPPPAARLVAQPPPCLPCVPRTVWVHAPPPRRSVQLIGGGGAGAAHGVPGCRQGDDQGTPPAPTSVVRRRLARPFAAPSSCAPHARRPLRR